MIAWRVYADGSYRQGYAYAGALVVASDDTIVLEASLVSPIRPAKKKSPSAKAEMYAATCGLDLLQSVSKGDEYAILYIDNMQVMHFIEREGPEVKHDPFGDQLLAAVRREKHRFHVEHSKKRDAIHSHLAHWLSRIAHGRFCRSAGKYIPFNRPDGLFKNDLLEGRRTQAPRKALTSPLSHWLRPATQLREYDEHGFEEDLEKTKR